MKFAFIGMVVRGARGLARRILCLAHSIAECPSEGPRTTAGQGASRLPRQRPYLRGPACLT
jgi:hypothetical protein